MVPDFEEIDTMRTFTTTPASCPPASCLSPGADFAIYSVQRQLEALSGLSARHSH